MDSDADDSEADAITDDEDDDNFDNDSSMRTIRSKKIAVVRGIWRRILMVTLLGGGQNWYGYIRGNERRISVVVAWPMMAIVASCSFQGGRSRNLRENRVVCVSRVCVRKGVFFGVLGVFDFLGLCLYMYLCI